MATEFVQRMCERFLADYMVGRYGFNGVVTHDEYLSISRCMRSIVRRRGLPLKVLATNGRVLVYLDEDKLTPDERARYEVANRALIDSMFREERPRIEWPLDPR